MNGERVEGVLAFNSMEPGSFTPEFVELLQRLTENVGFALMNFDRADEKARTEEQKERLTRMLLNRMAKLTVGNGLKPGVEIGPLVNHAQLERVQRYIQAGMQEGARLLTGGKALTDGEYARGHFFAPTLFDQVKPTMRIAQEEIFGPVLGVIEVKDLEEAIAVNNSVQYGLSTALYTRDLNRAQRAMRDIRTAIVYINAGTIGSEVHLPFGGMRRTGNGHREAGQAALDTFSEWKAIYVDYSGRLQRAQIDKD